MIIIFKLLILIQPILSQFQCDPTKNYCCKKSCLSCSENQISESNTVANAQVPNVYNALMDFKKTLTILKIVFLSAAKQDKFKMIKANAIMGASMIRFLISTTNRLVVKQKLNALRYNKYLSCKIKTILFPLCLIKL
ncbi:hypothetical protein TTHERM_00105390 (macronuclear) [Tetrahymena thermophila SB210]|uniref:Transmembrane protein n=1 Tax=Tetrahymena thermophila (strain SB210) TaxID=312017 RepID=Q234F9_TETTS|nr:hypothetical protein TTHERM_00105390 [Tetrahymena thermophila SB210]EAR92044.2 hypothetical protein TTHERM_00105390 [Tetrahymena thermophila SB210]|eukprot:XP_001012289.2 hypothetical protein TTHERM_00105390 [Tetrahymena thermophila SB210]